METRTLYPGITLHAEKDTRFKTEYLSVNFICSGSLFDRPHASILSAVLGRGTLNHPTQADLDKVLADLYDASLYTKGYCLGETFIQPFSLSCHKERFIPGETGLRRRARKLLFEMILEPLTEKDGFLSRYVEDEKKNKMDQLSAEKNNKPS